MQRRKKINSSIVSNKRLFYWHSTRANLKGNVAAKELWIITFLSHSWWFFLLASNGMHARSNKFHLVLIHWLRHYIKYATTMTHLRLLCPTKKLNKFLWNLICIFFDLFYINNFMWKVWQHCKMHSLEFTLYHLNKLKIINSTLDFSCKSRGQTSII